ncbi:hypothetical protein PCASD_26465 [Puccinia coronata f. sp. avenae]|uniref:Uncharacterized protein n=1 Tax=Puccinia coronata f. sp. avenae TaxID=200324 RepID=A0A2N5RZY5_9BASI|nr:hypothetical protein PCASD_26465 [Puccinia coronata f. sp. avenae]
MLIPATNPKVTRRLHESVRVHQRAHASPIENNHGQGEGSESTFRLSTTVTGISVASELDDIHDLDVGTPEPPSTSSASTTCTDSAPSPSLMKVRQSSRTRSTSDSSSATELAQGYEKAVTSPASTFEEDHEAYLICTHWESHGGKFEAFLQLCGIDHQDRQTREILAHKQIDHWSVFLHTVLDDHLHWGIELAAAQRLARGGAKVLRGLQATFFP